MEMQKQTKMSITWLCVLHTPPVDALSAAGGRWGGCAGRWQRGRPGAREGAPWGPRTAALGAWLQWATTRSEVQVGTAEVNLLWGCELTWRIGDAAPGPPAWIHRILSPAPVPVHTSCLGLNSGPGYWNCFRRGWSHKRTTGSSLHSPHHPPSVPGSVAGPMPDTCVPAGAPGNLLLFESPGGCWGWQRQGCYHTETEHSCAAHSVMYLGSGSDGLCPQLPCYLPVLLLAPLLLLCLCLEPALLPNPVSLGLLPSCSSCDLARRQALFPHRLVWEPQPQLGPGRAEGSRGLGVWLLPGTQPYSPFPFPWPSLAGRKVGSCRTGGPWSRSWGSQKEDSAAPWFSQARGCAESTVTAHPAVGCDCELRLGLWIWVWSLLEPSADVVGWGRCRSPPPLWLAPYCTLDVTL